MHNWPKIRFPLKLWKIRLKRLLKIVNQRYEVPSQNMAIPPLYSITMPRYHSKPNSDYFIFCNNKWFTVYSEPYLRFTTYFAKDWKLHCACLHKTNSTPRLTKQGNSHGHGAKMVRALGLISWSLLLPCRNLNLSGFTVQCYARKVLKTKWKRIMVCSCLKKMLTWYFCHIDHNHPDFVTWLVGIDFVSGPTPQGKRD